MLPAGDFRHNVLCGVMTCINANVKNINQTILILIIDC